MRALIAVVTSAGCGFTVAGGSAPVVDGAPQDTTSTIVDGMPDSMGTSACPWSYQHQYVDPCDDARPMTVDVLDLADSATPYGYDTSTGVLTLPDNTTSMPPSTMTAGVRILWTAGVRVRSGARLRITGGLPLAIVSNDDILVEGTIDAGSAYEAASNTQSLGPGANPASCAAIAAANGQTCAQHGGSGGGGGGFGRAGATGGAGGVGHTCTTDGKPGGVGGMALASAPLTLRGGCPGGMGAASTETGAVGGAGGGGGGALAFVARDTVQIDGRVTAGGAGGGPGLVARAGAGGGGSGGLLVIEAVALRVTSDGLVGANGGGGGGGSDNGGATPGEDGRADDQQATGGLKDGSAGNGGKGAAGSATAEIGATAERGGGGGGGGVGFVRFNAGTTTIDGKVSPPAS